MVRRIVMLGRVNKISWQGDQDSCQVSAICPIINNSSIKF